MGLREVLVDAAAAAARAAVPAVGGGDGDRVDRLAVDALRVALAGAPVRLRVVAGEGEKDEAPMLDPGETLGAGGPEHDLVVDPIDGTRLAAAGRPGAMAVLAAGPRGAFLDIGPAHYLDKRLAAAPAAAVPSLREPGAAAVGGILAELALALRRPVAELTAFVQSRPRNDEVAAAVRAAGARVVGFEHGDIERVVQVLRGDAALLLGIGGAPEGVVELALARMLGGAAALRFAPQRSAEAARVAAFADVDAAALPVGGLGAWLEAPDAADTSGLDAASVAAGPGTVVVLASATGVDLGGGLHLPPVGDDGAVEVWSVADGVERVDRVRVRPVVAGS